MKRRDFLKTSSLVSASVMMPRFLYGTSALMGGSVGNGRNLVVIQLSGGNDGLNTVIPYRNDIYYKSRPAIGITRSEALRLNDEMGLNPSMVGMKSLFDDGLLSIFNGVGYPDANRSHFRSTDIWQSGSSGKQYIQSGWLGRYMDGLEDIPCHHAIELDDSLGRALRGESAKGLAVSNFNQFYQTSKDPLIRGLAENARNHSEDHHHDEVAYLHKVLVDTVDSADYLKEKQHATSSGNYPQTKIARQLKDIAGFINAGAETRIYYLSLGGFDTHVNQAGNHGRLLEQYASAVKAFMDDLKAKGRHEETLVLTFSEFGRRVKENGGRGTDHGTANNVFLTGGALAKPGIIGAMPDLADLSNGDMKFNLDYRRIYAGVLNDWLGVDPGGIISPGIEPMKLTS